MHDITQAEPFEIVGVLNLFFQPIDAPSKVGMQVETVPCMYRTEGFEALQVCDGLYQLFEDLHDCGVNEDMHVEAFEKYLAGITKIEFGRVQVYDVARLGRDIGRIFFWFSEPQQEV